MLVYNSIFHSENNLRFNGELIAYSVDPSVHHTSGMNEGGIVQNTSHNGTKYFWIHIKISVKVEKILKGSLESIPSPSPSKKI